MQQLLDFLLFHVFFNLFFLPFELTTDLSEIDFLMFVKSVNSSLGYPIYNCFLFLEIDDKVFKLSLGLLFLLVFIQMLVIINIALPRYTISLMFNEISLPSLPVTYFTSRSLLKLFLLLINAFMLPQGECRMELLATFITTRHYYNITKFN